MDLIPLIADQYQHEIIKIVLERLSDILVTNSKQRNGPSLVVTSITMKQLKYQPMKPQIL